MTSHARLGVHNEVIAHNSYCMNLIHPYTHVCVFMHHTSYIHTLCIYTAQLYLNIMYLCFVHLHSRHNLVLIYHPHPPPTPLPALLVSVFCHTPLSIH